MKIVKLLPLTLLALSVTFTACNSDRAEEIKGGETVLELSSSISKTRVTTQADGMTNHWDGNEQIGVSSSSLTAQNVLYTATTAGATTDFGTQAPIAIPMGTTSHDIKAYYPYVTSATTEATYDLATDNKQPVLYATGTVTHANPKLDLNFTHKLGKLRIVVDKTESLTPNEAVGNVSVTDVLTKGKLTIETGNFVVEATKGNLTLNAKGNEYYTYLMPGETIKDKVITIVHGGKNYKATLTSTVNVEAGKYYLYTIKLGKGEAKVETGNGTIGNESEGDTGTVPGAPEAGTGTTPATPVTPVTATLSGTGYTNGTLSVPAAGGSYTLTLSGLEAGTTVSASATPAASWVSFTGDVALRAAADQTFSIKVEANDQTVARETTITLTADGMNDLTFKISQAAKEETVKPTPGPEQPVDNALYEGNNIESHFNALKTRFAKINATAGKNGGQAIVLNGSETGNNDVFEINVPASFNNKPKTISFYIKGKATGPLVFRVYGASGSLIDSNKGFLVETGSASPFTFGSYSYTKEINTQNDWVKVTLDMTSLPSNTELASTADGGLFKVRVGRNKSYDLMISDFTVEY